MSIALIGRWGDPIDPGHHREVIIQTVKRFDCQCAFCGVQMPQTANEPFAGLRVCAREEGLAIELANLVPLCGVCVRFNDLNNLIGCGQFVELPWLSQGQLTNMLRVIYCAQASSSADIQKSRVYQGSNGLLQTLARTPAEWEEHHFDGSVERVMDAVKAHTGFVDGEHPSPLYIDRLRFFWRPEVFKDDIAFWTPTIETQILNEEYREVEEQEEQRL